MIGVIEIEIIGIGTGTGTVEGTNMIETAETEMIEREYTLRLEGAGVLLEREVRSVEQELNNGTEKGKRICDLTSGKSF